jgi:4-alpha-glucanotransferase
MRFPRCSGVLLHPTSLPGPHGSGDFGAAARHFVDWLAAAGQRLWQILPLGGIGPGHSPYMSTSAFAGNVLLIDLVALHERGWLTAGEIAAPPGVETQRVNFEVVVPFRLDRLRRAARRFSAGASAAEREQLEDFRHAQSGWLDDYALFMAIADREGGRLWCEWAPELARREPAALRAARADLAEAVSFWVFCQWCFFEQWRQVREHAASRGVQIVGDAPIFIAHHSAEAWSRQDLFEFDAAGRTAVVAGVPPDAFSATGQRWGNPLYRWSAHAAEGYAWWISRLRSLFDLVDVVRIDHFRGFAAHWEIPASEPTAMHGRWVLGPGAALFEAVFAALGPRPIIAEDLGVITPDVHALRHQLGLPGMRILQFAFGGASNNAYLPHNFEPDTVVYTGTHDNDTSLGWWQHAPEDVRQHVRAYLGCDGHEIHWDLIRAACASVADTAIHPMQDVLGLSSEHRMNFPGQDNGWWAWRFDWSQVEPWHAQRLGRLTALYRRDGTPYPAP